VQVQVLVVIASDKKVQQVVACLKN